MRKYIPLICFAVFSCQSSQAQQTADSVKSTILSLFEGMINADSATVRNAFSDSAVMQTIVTTQPGSVTVKNQLVGDFVAFIGKTVKGVADERIEFGSILIDGDLASVWTPYRFYYNGKFSHCGVNSFQLIRGTKGWQIQYLIDTRRKSPCN